MITGREPNILRRLAPTDQERLLAKEREAERKYLAQKEKIEQQLFNKWLKEQREAGKLYFLNPRSDKPSTIQPGHPDYTIWTRSIPPILIEMKVAGGELSAEQQQAISELEHLEHAVWVAWNHHEAMRIVEFYLAGELPPKHYGTSTSQTAE
jgi:hypothetical protein